MDIDKLATERILKVRADLIMSSTFYGCLVSQVVPVPSRKFPTMATNGRKHFFNPDYIAKLTLKEAFGVQRHESEHDGRKHHSRRGNRDPREWNICTDYAINIDLIDEGITLPKGALVDPRYRGWSAEDIYRARELDRKEQEKQKNEQQKDDKEDSEPEDENEPDTGDENAGDNADEDDSKDTGEDTGGDTDEGKDESKSNEAGNGEDADAEDDAENGNGSEAGDDEGKAEGSGSGDGEDAEGEAEGSQPSSGDPGGCGEVLDAADDEVGNAESEANWDRIVQQAAILSEKRGDLPGHVSRDIERAKQPKQNWREVLRAWIDAGAKRIETWNRPNRRYLGQGLVLPGSVRDGLNKVVFLVDTSGSMDDIALAAINTEIQAALDEGAIDQVIVVYGDTHVTRVDEYVEGDEIVFDPRGGGGTRMAPLFDWVRDNIEDPSLIVLFTDGYFENLDDYPMPETPVLFAYTGYPDAVRRHLENTPWNSPGIDVGEH